MLVNTIFNSFGFLRAEEYYLATLYFEVCDVEVKFIPSVLPSFVTRSASASVLASKSACVGSEKLMIRTLLRRANLSSTSSSIDSSSGVCFSRV